MAGYYVVKQGDYVSSIAAENGFGDYRILWDHPQNAELKQKRQNPNVLYPGDRLYIPDREEGREACPTDQRHVFKARTSKLRLRLVLEDFFEQPIAGTPCDLVLPGETRRVTTDGSGKFDEVIPSDTHQALLLIRGPETAFEDEQIPVIIGHLDPIDETSGQAARLANLGYYFGPLDPVDKDDFLSALEEFQCDHGLKVDGKFGPETKTKLKQVHGC